MIEYNIEEVYEKETGVPAINSQGEPDIEFVDWQKKRNKELVEALIGEYKYYAIIANAFKIVNNDAEWLKRMEDLEVIVERNTGKKIEELIK